MQPLAKSLHTITVLVRLARHVMQSSDLPAPDALGMALTILELDAPDTHGLIPKALKQLEKQRGET